MAEHPGTMRVGDYDLSGFCVGVVDRPKMLGPQLVREGDIILGLASSGLHSNGFSLVRRALTDGLSDEDLATRELPDGGQLASALLTPTRVYVKPLLEAVEAGLPLHAAAHITGGGITENLNRALPAGLNAHIELGTWEVPAVIQTVVEAAGLDEREALKTFNMGIGMALICPPSAAPVLTEHFSASGRVFPLGTVRQAATPTSPAQVLYRRVVKR
jgi:phosphoribosylformylglycinamidine cyclo-ligase